MAGNKPLFERDANGIVQVSNKKFTVSVVHAIFIVLREFKLLSV